MKEFTEKDCIRTIKRTMGCNVVGKTIKVNKENHSAGLKTWSKIDYLVKNFGYVQVFVSNTENNEDGKVEREERHRLTKEERHQQKDKFRVKLPKLNFKKL